MSTTKVDKLKSFYTYVETELPDGLRGIENAFNVRIGEEEFKAVLFGLFDKTVEIGLLIEGRKYSRKTVIIDAEGNVTEDTEGTIPNFDLTDNEPNFSGMSNEQIALTVTDQINGILFPNQS